MKKGWTREYWFLLGLWLFSMLAGWLISALIEVRVDPLLLLFRLMEREETVPWGMLLPACLLTCFPALQAAAWRFIAIRFGMKPCLPVFAAFCLSAWWTGLHTVFPASAPDTAARRYLLNVLLLPVLQCAVLYLLATGLLRLFRGREWAAFLGLEGVYLLAEAGMQWLGHTFNAAYWPLRLRDAVLRIVAYWLLAFCVRRWWETKPAHAAGEDRREV